MSESKPLLSVEDLRLYFRTSRGIVQAVDQVSFAVHPNRTLVVLGESGCGKSSLMRAILRLLPRNVHTYSGRILLDGEDIMTFGEERFRQEVRWVKISFVPQAAMSALNPVTRVGDQVAEPLVTHRKVQQKDEAIARAREALAAVGVPDDFFHRYAFELSGGMRQRTATAMALVTDPKLVIMDEPTSALDVLTQANMMNVFKRLKERLGVSFILITHDIATSSEIADDVAVMYAGQIVELAPAARFYHEPLHPYSRMLMASVPTLKQRRKKLEFIPGQPPSLIQPPGGCRFADRCPARFEACSEAPPLSVLDDGRRVKCWLHHKGGKADARTGADARAHA